LRQALQVSGLPTTLLIGPEGQVLARHLGQSSGPSSSSFCGSSGKGPHVQGIVFVRRLPATIWQKRAHRIGYPLGIYYARY